MLNVDYNNVFGTCDFNSNRGEIYKATICKANCLFAVIVFEKENKKTVATLVAFFEDMTHLKTCIGLSKNYDGTKNNILKGEFDNFVIDTTKKSPYGDKMSTVYNNLVKAGFKCKEFKPKGLKKVINKEV